MTLAEDDSVKGSRELEGDDHPSLLTGDVQPSDLWHVAGLLSLLSKRLNLAIGNLRQGEGYLVPD